MTSCADVRLELIALLRGECDPPLAASLERHLAGCGACSLERESLLVTLETVHRHVHPEVSPDARMRLGAALTEELARSRGRRPPRLLRPILAVPIAAAAGALFAWWTGPAPPVVQAPSATSAAVAISEPELSEDPASAGRVAAEPVSGAARAASRGLDWLASRQAPDGTWAPEADAGPQSRAAVTATVLLAFASAGETPRRGPRTAHLGRATARLVQMVQAGFPADPEAKPLYAEALGIRALAEIYAADRESMGREEARGMRDVLRAAGQRLAASQGGDGGFGYTAQSRQSDASCTIFAAAALESLRGADVLDASAAAGRARTYLAGLRDHDGMLGYLRQGDGRSSTALTAALSAMGGGAGSARVSPTALARIEDAVAAGGDAILAWTGIGALLRHGRSPRQPVNALVAGQRSDGAWPAAGDRHCAAGGDAVTTAFGVLALSQVLHR